MTSDKKDQRSLSSKKRGYLLAILGGTFGLPIGWVVSPLVLFGLNRTMKEKDGKKPNVFKRWALIGIVGAPLCFSVYLNHLPNKSWYWIITFTLPVAVD